MIKDITLGQYYSTESTIHKLDPRTKIMSLILFMVFLFSFTSLKTIAISAVFVAITINLSKVPIKYIVKGLKPVIFIIIFTVIIHLFIHDGKVIFKIFILKITDTGIIYAITLSTRIIIMILFSSLLTFTTSPMEITNGIERLLDPFQKGYSLAHNISLMMSIAIRFIPTIIDEADKIMNAQLSRGANFNEGNIFNKVRSLIPIIVPLMLSAIRRADDLAFAMESRCYNGGKNRTRFKELKYTYRDLLAYLFILSYGGLLWAIAKIL